MKRCSQTFLWMTLTVIFLQSISVVGHECSGPSKLHESKYEEKCCIPITVTKGYQPVLCITEGKKASQEPCPANTYQSSEVSSTEFLLCERHSTCPSPNMVTLRNGTTTSNTFCQCNESGGYYDNRSETTFPLEFYHCIHVVTASQSSSVHTVTSKYPVETSSNVPISENWHWIWISCPVLAVLAFIVVIGAIVGVICHKKKFRACNQRRNETIEVSPIVVVDQSSTLHNGQISGTSNAAETNAHRLLNVNESSNVQDNGSDVNYDLQSDYDNPSSLISASLCCERDR